MTRMIFAAFRSTDPWAPFIRDKVISVCRVRAWSVDHREPRIQRHSLLQRLRASLILS
jgi:hypothetical protein